jgi:hypothetical protein
VHDSVSSRVLQRKVIRKSFRSCQCMAHGQGNSRLAQNVSNLPARCRLGACAAQFKASTSVTAAQSAS